jgi:hypothetical protein
MPIIVRTRPDLRTTQVVSAACDTLLAMYVKYIVVDFDFNEVVTIQNIQRFSVDGLACYPYLWIAREKVLQHK